MVFDREFGDGDMAMGFFDWFRKPAVPDAVYSVMNDDHVHLYRILGELRQGTCGRAGRSGSRDDKRDHCLDVVGRLIKDSDEHFQREEALMEAHRYPAIRAHKDEHLMLRRSIQVYHAKLSAGALPPVEEISQYLKGWLTTHIRSTDRQLERFLFDAHKARDGHGQMALSPADLARFNAMVAAGRAPARGRSKA